MIRYVYGDKLGRQEKLARGMFRDRADQFKRRQKWAVQVNDAGEERDTYDTLNPLYVIWENQDGTHGGSMRFLPTVGPTMVNEHFLDLTDGVRIESPLIWECTRFCLGPEASPRVSAALMQAGGEIMRRFGIGHFVGVFDRRMIRIYRQIGASPDVLGTRGAGPERISVGLWAFSEQSRRRISRHAGVSDLVSEYWFERSFGELKPKPAKIA